MGRCCWVARKSTSKETICEHALNFDSPRRPLDYAVYFSIGVENASFTQLSKESHGMILSRLEKKYEQSFIVILSSDESPRKVCLALAMYNSQILPQVTTSTLVLEIK